jgi:hypothetical protein
VPNRYFPIEHHTALPIVHYQDYIFQIACRITGKSEWARNANLILMTRKRLWQLAAPIEKGRPSVILVYCSDLFHQICISNFTRHPCQCRLGVNKFPYAGCHENGCF